jgi:hypothetical protein
LGVTELTVGAGTTLYLLFGVFVPLGVVTSTLFGPEVVKLGNTQVILVALFTVKLTHAWLSTITAVAPVKPVPVMAIETPGVFKGPLVGEADVTVGAAKYVKTLALVTESTAVATVTSTVPAKCELVVQLIWVAEKLVTAQLAGAVSEGVWNVTVGIVLAPTVIGVMRA